MKKSVTIKGSGARRLRSGGQWVYANEISDRLPSFERGEMVRVLAPGGQSMGLGYIEPNSLIALRLMRRSEETIDKSFLLRRITAAEASRRRFVRETAYRLVFSEADRLPGLIIDRYGELLVLQCLTWGIERLKSMIIETLTESYRPRAIIVRNDNDNRRELGLPTEDEHLLFDASVDLSNHEVSLLRLSLTVDFVHAQKTGLFLDQVATYHTVDSIDFTGMEGADLFCYSGIFGMIALRRGAKKVRFVDSSAPALSLLEQNLAHNGFAESTYDVERADVLSYLENCPPEGHDFVFLDPPKYIRSRRDYYRGLQGYFNLNRSAARALGAGGLLFTFSCSHHANEETFRKKVLDAVGKSGGTAREIAHFRQNADHPVLLPMEESFYLKGLLIAVERWKEDAE